MRIKNNLCLPFPGKGLKRCCHPEGQHGKPDTIMKTAQRGENSHRKPGYSSARALIVAGFLFGLIANVENACGQIPAVSYTPLDSWSFADTSGWTSDNGFSPVSFTNLTSSIYGDILYGSGTALVVDSTNPAGLEYNVVESFGATNLTVNQGSVTMWFAPSSWTSTNAGGSGLVESGQLIDAGQWTSNATYGWWSLNIDPAAANLYFSAQDNIGDTTNYLSAPISWTSNQWHFVALTYSATNTTLYLDGQLATNGAGMSIWPDPTVLANGFFIGSDSYGLTQAHGMFDDIYTYNVVIDPVTISNTFSSFQPSFYLLDSWSFNDTNFWSSDFGYAPLSFTNLNVSTLGDGTALVLDTNVPAWLQFNVVETNNRPNLTLNQGSITMWFAPDWASYNAGGTGPGSTGELINVGQWTSAATNGWWSLNVDSTGDNLSFSAQDNAGDATNYLSVPIAWTYNRWHFIALTYSSNSTALYIDGNLATNGAGVSILPGTNALSSGLYIGSDTNGNSQAHGMFDDIYTYSIPLNAGAVSSAFDSLESYYFINPLNIGNDSLSSAPSSPTTVPTFNAISGGGNLQPLILSSGCGTSTNFWMTRPVAITTGSGTNVTMDVTFTIEGGSAGVPYDVFANSVLGQPVSTAPWAWMGQGNQCDTYMLTNLPNTISNTACFFLLGSPQDSDGDGLTDAYKIFVLGIGTNNPDYNGDGMLNGWKVLWNLNVLSNNWQQASERSNYSYDPVGEVQQVTGVRSGGITNDPEGNVTGVSQ
jgi:hypothetical protein